jgi:beta-galactosidase
LRFLGEQAKGVNHEGSRRTALAFSVLRGLDGVILWQLVSLAIMGTSIVRHFLAAIVVSSAFVAPPVVRAQGAPARTHHIAIEDDHFALDGKLFQIISGELHYERIPREYWRDRLKKARAMGLNTISTYVFWNAHEPKPGVYDFNGMLDVTEFVRTAQEEGLYVILRPGPYACAEWDLGGLPAWLLADPDIVLRSADEKFLSPAERWLKRLGKELAPLQLTRGGPIIAVQSEMARLFAPPEKCCQKLLDTHHRR